MVRTRKVAPRFRIVGALCIVGAAALTLGSCKREDARQLERETKQAAREAKDEVKNTVNCSVICDRYDNCVKDIDVVACADKCEDKADKDKSYALAAQRCENCASGKACAEATGCWADCPVVPVRVN